MASARSTLNKLKWTNCDFSKVEVWYVHRGAPSDTKIIGAGEILEIGKAFLEIKSCGAEQTGIPYHRIFRIVYDGKVVYDKRKRVVAQE